MKKIMKALIVTFILTSFAFQAQAAEDLEIVKPWIVSVPPIAKMSAAFMTIKNTGSQDRYLVGVKADFSKHAELHTTKKVDDIMKMRPLKKLKVPKDGSVSLSPGKHHIMFMGLKQKLQKGHQFTLIFKNGEQIKVTAPVKKKN